MSLSVKTKNMETSAPSVIDRLNNWISNSVTIKIIVIGILILILMIPTSFIQSLIHERQYRQEEAINEVSDKWGNVQTLNGPVLTIPYKKYSQSTYGKETTEYIRILPETLAITGALNPETRYRGIFEVVVYNAQLQVNGTFPALTIPSVNPEHIQWQDAFLSVGISDMRGIRDMLKLNWNGQILQPEPGIGNGGISTSGVSCKVPVALDSTGYSFSFGLNLNGSNSFYFVPLGKETNVSIQSAWKNPSFTGAFLPVSREINNEGFTASWKALHLNRNYPQTWIENTYDVLESSFGVGLLVPVEQYQKSIRSVKYALMFISLTFLFFFLVEVMNRRNIHPIQYILVGLALCLFYTLLVALSEHISFNKAYLVSSIGIIGMITLYSRSIFQKNLLTLVMSLVLIALYGFLFSTLQLQDYSLLIGSIGLFLILGIVMFLSRNIDWYGMKKQGE